MAAKPSPGQSSVIGENSRERRVRGIIHCHTDLSYDGSIPLSTLCSVLKNIGFGFVALTEHAKGLTPEKYRELVADCRKISSDSFVVIPGLEIRLDDGSEMGAVGVSEFIHASCRPEVLDRIRQQGGYAIWVHPHKSGRQELAKGDCDAIEILNGKIDGNVAPGISLFFQSREFLRSGKKIHVIFGADMHYLPGTMTVWTECEVARLSHDEILQALKKGRYINQAAKIRVASNGDITVFDLAKLVLLRVGYMFWNTLLEKLPENARENAIHVSRKFISYIKRN